MTLRCPFCEQEMVSDGEVELLRGAAIPTRLFWSANLRHVVVTEVNRCTDCGFLALFSPDEGEGPPPQAEEISPKIKRCPDCGARNFRRSRCHTCGRNLT